MKKIITIIAILLCCRLSSQTISPLISNWPNNFSTAPSQKLLDDLSALVDSINADSNWVEIDFLAVMAGMETTEQLLTPLKTTSGNTMTPVSSPVMDSSGVKGNKVNSFIKSGWNPTVDAIKYGLYNGYTGTYHTTQGTTINRRFFGSTPWCFMIRTGVGTICNINFSSGGAFTHTLDLGYKAMFLDNVLGSDLSFFHGGTTTTISHNPISQIPNGEFYICAASYYDTGVATSHTDAKIRLLIVGSNKINSAKINYRINTFFAARGLTTY